MAVSVRWLSTTKLKCKSGGWAFWAEISRVPVVIGQEPTFRNGLDSLYIDPDADPLTSERKVNIDERPVLVGIDEGLRKSPIRLFPRLFVRGSKYRSSNTFHAFGNRFLAAGLTLLGFSGIRTPCGGQEKSLGSPAEVL